MADFVGAIDQGTTSTRFMIFDHGGNEIGRHQLEHEQILPKAGWVEHNPIEIWERTVAVTRTAMQASSLAASDLAALGVTNQRETAVVWNRRTGRPYYNAIVWQDTRTDTIINDFARDGGQDRLRAKVGLPLATYFSGPKVKWILDNVQGARAKAEAGDLIFGNMDTWCIWNLTGGVNGGVHVTDVTNASRTMLMNLETLDWDNEILSLMGIPRSMLPQIKASSEVYGKGVGTLAGIPIAGDLGDQQAALFGQTCFSAGEAKNTYGTGCFMLLHTGGRVVSSKNGLVSTACAQTAKKEYALEGSVFIAGAVVQWLRDEMKFVENSKDIEKLAASVLDSNGVYVVPAFTGLGAPHWDPDARGAILGLTRGTSQAHIARAALESIAFQSAEVLEAMQKDSGEKLKELRVDGGAAANDLLMQFQADLLGVPVLRPKVLETTALGAAYLAGLTVDLWKSREEIAAHWQLEQRFEPRMERAAAAERLGRWREAVQRARGWARS